MLWAAQHLQALAHHFTQARVPPITQARVLPITQAQPHPPSQALPHLMLPMATQVPIPIPLFHGSRTFPHHPHQHPPLSSPTTSTFMQALLVPPLHLH